MRRACALITASFLAASAPALAQSSGRTGIASQLFDAGRDLMKHGDYQAACPKLAESARLEPRVGTLARLAECEEKLGHLASARGHWQDAADLARTTKDDRLGHVEQELERVDATVPKLVLRSAEASPPRGLTVRIDALSVGAESLGLPLPLDPGRHAVSARAPGRTSWSTTVDLPSGGAATPLEIPVLAPAQPATPSAAPASTVAPRTKLEPLAPAPERPRSSHRPLATVGVITGVVGLVAVGAGAGFGAGAMSLRDKSYDEGCQTDGTCFGQAAASDHDAALTFATISTASFIIGGVLVAAGVVLFVVAPKKSSTIALGIAPGGLVGTW